MRNRKIQYGITSVLRGKESDVVQYDIQSNENRESSLACGVMIKNDVKAISVAWERKSDWGEG